VKWGCAPQSPSGLDPVTNVAYRERNHKLKRFNLECEHMPSTSAERVCFLLRLKPDRVQDYLQAHQTVWPEMLDALSRAGWQNYSLFVHPEDGLVVGYLETDDFAAAATRMSQTAVNEKWQATMAGYFQPADGRTPDQAMDRLTEYFHLP
jgi:L-rhamnose mutarotase